MNDIRSYWKSLNWLSLLLYPLSLLYCLIIKIRKFCYQHQCFHAASFSAPVIVIGNITVGGNGKTPLIIHLLEELKQRGYHPGVVSRGYQAQNPQLKQGKVMAVDTTKPSSEYGDEPWMIAKKTKSPVVVGIKRAKAVDYLIKQFDCDIVLSDDGMQHYAMGRDLEICVVDDNTRFGNGLCLPAGPLRETKSRLKEVDYIVYNKAEQTENTNHDIVMHLDFDHIYPLSNKMSASDLTIAGLKNKTVHAVAGIANPDRFFNQLKKHGINVIEHPFADHHQFIRSELEFKDDYPLIMTEKDAVKCFTLDLDNCFYISVKAELSLDLSAEIQNKFPH